jgi:hypothetical protein
MRMLRDDRKNKIVRVDGLVFKRKDDTEKLAWLLWDTSVTPPRWIDSGLQEPPPPGAFWTSAALESPLAIYVIGVSTVLLSVVITIGLAGKGNPQLVTAVLAAVTGVIGTFTGHAAGHAAAKSTPKP